jgi:hypothetical protein
MGVNHPERKEKIPPCPRAAFDIGGGFFGGIKIITFGIVYIHTGTPLFLKELMIPDLLRPVRFVLDAAECGFVALACQIVRQMHRVVL